MNFASLLTYYMFLAAAIFFAEDRHDSTIQMFCFGQSISLLYKKISVFFCNAIQPQSNVLQFLWTSRPSNAVQSVNIQCKINIIKLNMFCIQEVCHNKKSYMRSVSNTNYCIYNSSRIQDMFSFTVLSLPCTLTHTKKSHLLCIQDIHRLLFGSDYRASEKPYSLLSYMLRKHSVLQYYYRYIDQIYTMPCHCLFFTYLTSNGNLYRIQQNVVNEQ